MELQTVAPGDLEGMGLGEGVLEPLSRALQMTSWVTSFMSQEPPLRQAV